MSASGRGRSRNRGTPAPRRFPPPPLPGQVPRGPAAPAAARARRGPVLAAAGIGGAGLLGFSLSTTPDSPQFYILTMSLAGTWAAGALSSGPLPMGIPGQCNERRYALIVPVLTGAGAFGLCYGAARLAQHIRPLDRAIRSVLSYVAVGSMPLVLLTASANALAEEVFFHGALWALVEDSHPVITTTLAYAATRNPPGTRRNRDQRSVRPPAPHLRRPPGPGTQPSHLVTAHVALPSAPVPHRPP